MPRFAHYKKRVQNKKQQRKGKRNKDTKEHKLLRKPPVKVQGVGKNKE